MSPERTDLQQVPVKLYRTEDVVTVAAPMPGLEAENIAVDVTGDGRLVLRGQLRGALKDVKEILIDEWSVGPYHREVPLPCPVDGPGATITYGNGVLVVALPAATATRAAQLSLAPTAPTRGQRVPEGGSVHGARSAR
jgi:HSP20 family protein